MYLYLYLRSATRHWGLYQYQLIITRPAPFQVQNKKAEESDDDDINDIEFMKALKELEGKDIKSLQDIISNDNNF